MRVDSTERSEILVVDSLFLMNKLSPICLAALSLILLSGCAQKTTLEPTPPIVGGDRDAHGCIGSAGYSWCEAKQKCLRVWEEKCESASAASSASSAAETSSDRLIGGDKDEHGCLGPAGYTWCAAKQKCLRVWEEECFASVKEAIVWELAQKYEQRIRKEFTVTITQETKTHARGKISFGGPGTPGGMVLASKMTGIWRVVYEGNGSVDCAVLKAEEFPADMLKGFCD